MTQISTTQTTGAQTGATRIGATQTGVTQAGGAQTGGAQAAAPEGADPAASVLAAIRFDANGLVPAIAQQHDTGEVLMMAWMNPDSIRETLATARVCYYSRSRGGLWRKGETSGQTQHLRELRVDCDGDTLLLLVQQDGVACHTGRRSCFFRAARDGDLVEIAAPEVSPEALYGQAGCGHPHG